MSRLAIKRIQALILGTALALSCICFPLEISAEEENGQQTDEQQTEEAERPENLQEMEDLQQAEIDISAPSAVLMEASTGTVIYEKDVDTARPPASVTKVMTMLLILMHWRREASILRMR